MEDVQVVWPYFWFQTRYAAIWVKPRKYINKGKIDIFERKMVKVNQDVIISWKELGFI